ncbi:MAG: helix-turn-helix domain-containing protein [Rubrobacter sp.]|nr:helix-turn-helix domain-containing protein [Rubrobacter sp.]
MDIEESIGGSALEAGRGEPRGEYMTIQEFADLLRIGRGTAWSLVMERAEIPHLRVGDRVVRLARADVEDYLRRCRSDAEV